MHRIFYIALVHLLIMGVDVQAQQAPAASASAITSAPVIDGRLDDDSWAEAQILTGFIQREPSEGRPVSERTEVRIVYDGEALYIGAWLFDSDPTSLVFGQTLRDASLNESDAFILVLDTYLDRQNGFVFGTTPRTRAKVAAVAVGDPVVVVADNKGARAAASTSTGMEAGRLQPARTRVAGTLRCASPSRRCVMGQGGSKHGD